MNKKENMPAQIYAQPHTPKGKELDTKNLGGGAFDYSDIKTAGMETRGNGAATKGRIARGPMA